MPTRAEAARTQAKQQAEKMCHKMSNFVLTPISLVQHMVQTDASAIKVSKCKNCNMELKLVPSGLHPFKILFEGRALHEQCPYSVTLEAAEPVDLSHYESFIGTGAYSVHDTASNIPLPAPVNVLHVNSWQRLAFLFFTEISRIQHTATDNTSPRMLLQDFAFLYKLLNGERIQTDFAIVIPPDFSSTLEIYYGTDNVDRVLSSRSYSICIASRHRGRDDIIQLPVYDSTSNSLLWLDSTRYEDLKRLLVQNNQMDDMGDNAH